jgi:uncharacterized protein
MKEMFLSLDDEELDELEGYLLDRIDEDEDTFGKDEGILDISELDGLFTAIVSGPVVIQPSQWLAAIWGDFEPTWEGPEEFGTMMTLMLRHMNSIAAVLMEHPREFEPLFLEHIVDGRRYTIVDEWCHGYVRGIELCMDRWNVEESEMNRRLQPIMAFAGEDIWQSLDNLTDEEIDRMQQAIVPAVLEIHAWWLSRRMASQYEIDEPRRKVSTRVDRNSPCPCGSGKKYKKCCLH